MDVQLGQSSVDVPNRTGEYRGNNKQSHRHWVALKSTGHPSPSRVTAAAGAARANATKANAVASVHVFAENDVYLKAQEAQSYIICMMLSFPRNVIERRICNFVIMRNYSVGAGRTEIFVYELFR
jgi:hypothetical protein